MRMTINSPCTILTVISFVYVLTLTRSEPACDRQGPFHSTEEKEKVEKPSAAYTGQPIYTADKDSVNGSALSYPLHFITPHQPLRTHIPSAVPWMSVTVHRACGIQVDTIRVAFFNSTEE